MVDRENGYLDITARQLTLVQAADLARVPPANVRSWLKRGSITPGEKRDGQWWFSIGDAIRWATMNDLCGTRPICTITDAAIIGDLVVMHGMRSTNPADPHFVNILIGWNRRGDLLSTIHRVGKPGDYRPPVRPPNGEDSPLRRSHITVPATSIFTDVMLRTEGMGLENDHA